MKALAGLFVLFISFSLVFSEDPPPEPAAPPQCESSYDCPVDQACTADGACVDPCGITEVKCGVNSACLVHEHEPVCMCSAGFDGDPFTECSPEEPDCANDTDCSIGEACSGGKCIAAQCVDKKCGENAICTAGGEGDEHQCVCEAGYAGDPATACTLVPEPQAAPTADHAEAEPKSASCVGNLFPQPVGKKEYYVIHKHKSSWHNAFLYCLAHGMQLATIENEQENKAILAKIDEAGIRQSSFFVSGTDWAYDNQWMWMTTGVPIHNFTFWHVGRPWKNYYLYNCMQYHEKDKTSGYKWVDARCEKTVLAYFICQDYV